MATQTASQITVDNMAGCDIKFAVEYNGNTTPYTSSFPIDQSETIDLASYGIPVGTVLYPIIHADGGETKDGVTVTYDPAGNTASYRVTGGLDTLSITLQ
ncbi:hypothetical protein [Pseudomonas donghuensis]|uniref:hypothetical protein n=1 Tax=Pseudomonas donghuensis TaxID=1163398 RepID=UPI0021608EAD|nr:hypothetical protein [Pseudomonas donghuensis]UVL31834.1 hypothetical protein LOY32_12300 [Pseudomonas donghuensis]